MIFCLSTTIAAAVVYDEEKHVQPEALIEGCLRFATFAATEFDEKMFGDSPMSQESIDSAASYLQELLKNWWRWPDLEKGARDDEMIELICSMIYSTESNLPVEKDDIQRLRDLALQIYSQLPTMERAFVELANR